MRLLNLGGAGFLESGVLRMRDAIVSLWDAAMIHQRSRLVEELLVDGLMQTPDDSKVPHGVNRNDIASLHGCRT